MAATISDEATIVVAQNQVFGKLPDGDMAILDAEAGVYFGLNSVGARIWEIIQEPTKLKDIREQLLVEYDIDNETCNRELLALIDQLKSNGLIEIEHAT
jgi:hypothetical protein